MSQSIERLRHSSIEREGERGARRKREKERKREKDREMYKIIMRTKKVHVIEIVS